MQRLIVFTGPVSSEKTTRAMQVAKRYARLGHPVACLRPLRSIRGHERPGFLVTKNGESFPSVELDNAANLVAAAADAAVVWIDEPGLFVDEAAVFGQVQELRRRARTVLVSTIGATSEMEPFGTSVPRLLAVADDVVLLRGECDHCGGFGAASRSLCLRPKNGQVLIGGTDVYNAVCQACWTGAMTPKAD